MFWILGLALLAAPTRAAVPFALAGSSPTLQDFLADSKLKLSAGDAARAKDSASRAIALSPSNPIGYVQRASCELRLGQWPAAESDASQAIALKYEKASSYDLRSAARAQQGRYAEALADAERALQLAPQSAYARFNRATARAGLKAPEADILADFQRAAALDSRFQPAYQAFLKKTKSAPKPAPPAAGPAKLVKPPAAPAAPPASGAPAAAVAPRPRPRRPAWGRDLRWGGLGAGLALVVSFLLLFRGRGEHRLRQVRYAGVPIAPPSSDALAPGAVVGGRYIVGALSRRVGGVEYYDARDLSDLARVIKRLPAGSSAQARGAALARAQAAAGLKDSRVEAVEAFVQEAGHLALVCQPLPGEPLERLRQKWPGRKAPSEQALRLAQGACEALGAAHAAGLVHGRLSPASVWVERGSARLADFGLPAARVEGYAAPEPQPSVEGDIYALAACLFEALTGEALAGRSVDALRSSGHLAPVFATALAADPSERFHAASELLAAFRAAAGPI